MTWKDSGDSSQNSCEIVILSLPRRRSASPEPKNAPVACHAPHAPAFAHAGMAPRSVTDMDAALEGADCVLIATDHSLYKRRRYCGS